MVRRKVLLMCEFKDFQFRVDGEILAVGLPHWIFEKYPTNEQFFESFHFDSIEHIAAWAGADEIHFSSLNPEWPCFAEATLAGHEEGPGLFIVSWASQVVT